MPEFTPAYHTAKATYKALDNFIKNSGWQSFVSNLKGLKEKEIVKNLENIFADIASTVEDAQQIQEFLEQASKLLKGSNEEMAARMAAQLEKINRIGDARAKIEALKTLLVSKNLLTFLAQCIKQAYRPGKEELVKGVMDEYTNTFQKEMGEAAHQAVFRLEANIVRNTLKLLFQLFDLTLASVGIEPISKKPEESGKEKAFFPLPPAPK